MFTTPAFAADTAAAATTTADAATFQPGSLIPIFLVIIVFYFMVIRPQNKRAQEHRGMIAGLQKGDKVITGGGLIAKVHRVINDEEIILELADGVHVHALRTTIMAKKD